MRDPYGDEELIAVPRLRPDWAVIHVPVADACGNARIYGSPFWDRLMARAARGVLLTAERIVPSEALAEQPELTAIPELFVRAVVHVPRGAWPGSCYPDYDVDYAVVEVYAAEAKDPDALARHLTAAPEAGGVASGGSTGTGVAVGRPASTGPA